MRKLVRALSVVFLLVACAGSLSAQGIGAQFVNFEAPAHKPIAVVEVAGTQLLLVTNVPDNSVEVYTTNQPPAGTTAHQFLFRVPAGQRPVTVLARPTPTGPAGGRRIYVANWLGDSVTVFDLEPVGGGVVPPFTFSHVRSVPVGDEPVGIAFLPENPNDASTLPGGALHELVLVTFSAPEAWGIFARDTLTPVIGRIEMLTPGTPTLGVRDPRAIAWAPPPADGGVYKDQLWVLNFRGGVDPPGPATPPYDLDLWGTNDLVNAVTTEMSNLPNHTGFGSTNFNMAFAPNGDLWVVGLRARNRDIEDPNTANSEFVDALGEPLHQAMAVNETGFAVSYIARHTNLTAAGQAPERLDLNDSSQGTATPPVQATQAVTQPTDMVVYGPGDPGRTRIFTTGSSSDSLAAIEPTNTGVATWTVHRIDARPVNPFSLTNLSGGMRGPRGLALKQSGTQNDPNDRLYVYNRFEGSVTVVDPNFPTPAAAVLSTFSLQGLVEPPHVTDGRKFLYSSALSAAGNVSCASCHIDGNTDFLAWNLADGVPVLTPGAPNSLLGALGPNASNKGPMLVQPLRGLVNFEVVLDTTQDTFYSNRPYHWRGDRGFVEQFNGAFVNLMGAPNLNPGAPTPLFNEGLPAADMRIYRDFIFSIHYPPNPNQPTNRVYSGVMGDPNDPTVGTLAQLGIKGFHSVNSDGQRDPVTCANGITLTCENCHALPEGSNNLLTDQFTNPMGSITPPFVQRLETAQLKAMELKSKRLLRVVGGAFVQPQGLDVVTHEFGLVHTGESTIGAFSSNNINQFVDGFGVGLDCVNLGLRDGISHYVREFDSGMAPLVGFTSSLDVAQYSASPGAFQGVLTTLEQQRLQVNTGIAVHARVSGTLRGFFFDVTDASGTPYHEEAQTALPTIGPFSSTALLDLLNSSLGVDPTNLLTFHFTPLGSSRRVARVQGGLAPKLAGTAPTNLTLLPSPTMTANAPIPSMTTFWASQVNGFEQFLFVPASRVQAAAETHFQVSLVNHAPGGFGLSQLRREAPRRFRVSGDGITDGAFLLLFAPNAADIASAPAPGQPPTTTPTFAANFNFFLPVYPGRDAQNALIWETAAELDSTLMLGLLNGLTASSVAITAFTQPSNAMFFNLSPLSYVMSTTDLMQPTTFNWYFLQVVNSTPGGGFAIGSGGWQRLTITP